MPNTCPNCRRPVRVGARFCGFCAASLTPTPISPPAAAPDPASNLLPVAPSLDLTSEVRQRRGKRKRSRLIISLFFLLIICLVIAVPLISFGRPLIKDLFSRATLTSTATQTAISVPTNTPTLLPSLTQVPTSTPTRLPSPTSTRPPSATPTRLLPPTYTSTPIHVLLSDDFSQPLDLLWETWGIPDTTTVIFDTTSMLLLTAASVDAGGISSLSDRITVEPGLIITFTADVDYLDDDTAVLRFAWSPGNSIPPELADPLPFSVLIESKQLAVQIIKEDGTSTACTWPIEDAVHTFEIQFDRNLLPIIFVDDSPVCENLLAPIAQTDLLEGRIHFSGSGLIDDVSVSIAP
jgi:hypothetical protein